MLTVDLGEVSVGEPIPPIEFSISNLASESGAPLTAGLDLISVDSDPQSSFLMFSGALFENLPADESIDLSIEGTPADMGAGIAEFVLHVSDEQIPGAEPQTLQLIVSYDVVANVLLGDVGRDGVVDFSDIAPFIGILQSGTFLEEADCNQDGVVTFADIPAFIGILQSS